MKTRTREEIAPIQARYYERHKEAILKRNADYRAANLDKVNAQKREHNRRKVNRVKVAREAAEAAAARAREIVAQRRKSGYVGPLRPAWF